MGARSLKIETDGGEMDSYLATPAAPSGKGIVLLQEIFGVTDKVRRYCELFAAQGFMVMAPDLFWRIEPRVELPYTREGTLRAFEFLKQLDEEKAIADIEKTAVALALRAGAGARVAVIGFCLGGKLAARLATRGDVAAAVAFYGVGIEKFAAALGASSCPLQLHFAAQDRFVPPAARDAIGAALHGRARTELHVYDTNHAFFRAELDDAASRTSFDRTLAFLAAQGLS